MTFKIFIKFLRFETSWVRKNGFYKSFCLPVVCPAFDNAINIVRIIGLDWNLVHLLRAQKGRTSTILLQPFFSQNLRLYYWKVITYLWSKVLSVASHYFFPSFWQLSDTSPKKTMHLLKRSTNRSIFWPLHKSGNADESGRVPSIETNGSQKEQRLESTAGGVRPPISAFPSMSWPVLRHVAEHYNAGG